MGRESARLGRRRSTTQDHITDVALDLFASRGFDEVSVDDVARAAGIARRTLFRYYSSKNAIPWGDFDAHLDHMRNLLDEVPATCPSARRCAPRCWRSTLRRGRDGPAPPTHAGHPGDRRASGALDDDVCGVARCRRRVRGPQARSHADRPSAPDHRLDHAGCRALGLRALARRRIDAPVPQSLQRALGAAFDTVSADWPASDWRFVHAPRGERGFQHAIAKIFAIRASEFGPRWRR